MAFGSTVAWAENIPSELSALITDGLGSGYAILEALQRRRRGDVFYVAPLLSDRREQATTMFGAAIYDHFLEIDERYAAFDQLADDRLVVNGKPMAQYGSLEPNYAQTVRDLTQMGDAVLVRSPRDGERIAEIFTRVDPRVSMRSSLVEFAPADRTVPRVRPQRRSQAIVIWAPSRSIESLAVFLLAVEELRSPVFVICNGGVVPRGTRAQIVNPAQAQDVLPLARVVVAVEPYDPGVAYALAETATALACASSCGADSVLESIAVYDPWRWRSITAAILDAPGMGPPRFSREAKAVPGVLADKLLSRAVSIVVERAPLVSIVIPTYNRRGVLPISLDSMERQTYPNIETIVVQNGGANVEDIVARFPRSRRVVLDINESASTGLNAGIAASRGTFLGFLSDDDRFYPDHVSRLVEALESNAADVAHSIPIQSVFTQYEEGKYALVGVRITYNRAVSANDLSFCNFIQNAIMWRKSAFPDASFLPIADSAADYELWLKFSEFCDFVHVPRVTTEIAMRTDATNYSYAAQERNALVYQAIYDLHPVYRQTLLAARERHLVEVAAPMQPVMPPLYFNGLRADDWVFTLA